MSSTNKTSMGLNMWEASDKPVRRDFINDNVIVDAKIAKLNSNLIVSGGDINITGSDFSAGLIYYQNVGRISILSFGGLQFKNSFPSGSTIRLITLNNGSWPLVTTKSVMVCQNIPLYLTITTAGEIVLANYSGISVPAGTIAEGQVSYVTS